MTPRRVVLAGATGVLGRHVAGLLSGAGCSFRALGRNPSKLAALNATETRVCDLTQPASLRGVCDSADVLVSCAGAPVSFNSRDRSSFNSSRNWSTSVCRSRSRGVPRGSAADELSQYPVPINSATM